MVSDSFREAIFAGRKHVNKGGCGKDDIKEITFTANQEDTGPWLREQGSFLAVQAFIPEIYTKSSNKFGFKQEYLQRWIDQRLPVFLDVDPGYDAHIVFNNDTTWGNDDVWRIQLLVLRRDLPVKGVVFNTWNGYTEGYAAVPTLENGDADFRWMQELFS